MTRTRQISVSVFIILLLPLLASVGCRRDKELSRAQAELARAASNLVAQDAAARREIIAMQAALDDERRLLNERERQDPLIAQAILQIGGLALCLLPLLMIAWLLWRSDPEAEVTVLNELVIDELLLDHSAEPEPKRLDHRDLNALVRERLEDRSE